MVADYEKVIANELNLCNEAANTSQLRRNFMPAAAEAAACGPQPSAYDQETAAPAPEPSAFKQEPSASRQEPSASGQKSSASEQEPSASEQKPSASEQKPSASEQKPSASEQKPSAASADLYVPKVYWDYTRPNLLVMERIHGIPVTDVAALRAHGVNLKVLAETGVRVFFTQVFDHNFFHADMHPGNIFVSPERPQQPQYLAVDCAIIGSLSTVEQKYLGLNLLAIFQRDYRRVAELHLACGWVPPQTPVHEFEAAIRTVCEPIFDKPMREISFGQILVQLFRTAGRFDMEVQPSLLLLQKTLLNIEGLGRQLYPDLNLWYTALPYLEAWNRRRLSPCTLLGKLKHRVPELLELLLESPR